MTKIRYFSGPVELTGVYSEARNRFLAIGGHRSKHNAWYAVGRPLEGHDAILPVTRTIFLLANPSLHKCDSRCMHAKGQNCECSCRGANHGKGS